MSSTKPPPARMLSPSELCLFMLNLCLAEASGYTPPPKLLLLELNPVPGLFLVGGVGFCHVPITLSTGLPLLLSARYLLFGYGFDLVGETAF